MSSEKLLMEVAGFALANCSSDLIAILRKWFAVKYRVKMAHGGSDPPEMCFMKLLVRSFQVSYTARYCRLPNLPWFAASSASIICFTARQYRTRISIHASVSLFDMRVWVVELKA